MSSQMHKKPARRRRKTKKSIDQSSAFPLLDSLDASAQLQQQQQHSNPATSEVPNPPTNAKQPPRLSEQFVHEEQDVQRALRQRKAVIQEHGNGIQSAADDLHRDREIDFFTGSVRLTAIEETVWRQKRPESDDDDNDIVAADNGTDGGVSTLIVSADGGLMPPPPQSFRSAYTADDDDGGGDDSHQPQQLASSFIRIDGDDGDDEPVIRPWLPKRLQLADPTSELFFDSSKMAEQSDDDKLAHVRNSEQDGLFIQPRPVGFTEKSEKFIIERLLATGHTELVQISNGRRQLRDLRAYGSTKVYPKRLVFDRGFRPSIFDGSRAQLATVDTKASRQLRLFVRSISFDRTDLSHHDEEARLAEQIQKQYVRYVERERSPIEGQLMAKLQAIRKVLNDNFNESADASTFDSQRQHQLDNYRAERRDLRNRLHRERRTDRQLLRSILEQWKRLKDVRQRQNAVHTKLKLVIRTQEADESDDRRRWDRDFQTEYREVLEEAIRAYEKGVAEKQRDGEKPARPDAEKLRLTLHEVFSKSRRHPGEPHIGLQLERLEVDVDHDKSGVTKRFTVQLMVPNKKAESSVKVTQMVGQTAFLNAEFSIDWLTSEKVDTKGCKLVITDNTRTSLAQRMSATNVVLQLPLPPGQALYGDVDYIDLNFNTRSALTGTVSLKLGWSVTEPTHTASISHTRCNPSKTSFKLDEQIDPMDPDIASLLSGMSVIQPQQTNSIDGPKPATATAANDSNNAHEMFRLNEDLTAFCSKEILDKDARLNALIARDRNARNGVVAPSSREIAADADVGDDAVAIADRIIEDIDLMDPIDLQRHRGRKYLLNVYRTVGQQCDRLRKLSADQDLVIGNEVPTVATFIAGLRQLFRTVPGGRLEPARHLGVVPATATEPALLPSTVSFDQQQRQHPQQRLVVNILRAQGVPCRRQTMQRQQHSAGGDASTSATATRKQSAVSSIMSQHQQQCAASLVRPYAVVSLRDRSIRTGTADGSGSNPTWNEQLVLTMSGDYARRDVLCVQIFDEVVEDLLDGEERTRSSEIYQRISGRWLGELRIPMFVVLSERRIEGTFEMCTPQLLLGYTKPALTSASGGVKPSSLMLNVPQIRSSIYVTLFVHVEPTVVLPTMTPVHLECTELPAITARISSWLEQLREEFPQRRFFDPLVALSNGKRVCVTRLVGLIAVPFDEEQNTTEFLIRRFVSLVPLVRIGDECTKLNGVWLVNDQVLTLLTASAKDLGTMLVSFYLQLGYRAWLVVGHAQPTGDTAYVLLKENGEYVLVDPVSGRKYAAYDTHCPLRSVYAIVGVDNVWANVQRETRVFQTRFNVTHSADWRPLFGGGRSSNPLGTAPSGLVHNVRFAYTGGDDVTDLRRLIEWKLQKKIGSWRANKRTVWNRSLRETLYAMLVEMEEDACYEYEPKTYADRLAHLATVYETSGYPVQMTYSSLSAVVERVRSTGIHRHADGAVEFALTVYVQPYPCNVLSLWVFLVALVPKS